MPNTKKRILAVLCGFLLAVTCVGWPTVTVGAAATDTPVYIASLTYEFTIAGAAGETQLTFAAQTDGFSVLTDTIDLAAGGGNGDYSVTLHAGTGGAPGLTHLGYVVEVPGSGITVTVNKITVNGAYDLALTPPPVLQAGDNTLNGLPNIWSGLPDGDILCEAADGAAKIAYDATAGLLIFYQVSTSPGDTEPTGPVMTTSHSQDYAEALGFGWNLGNSFESFDMDESTPDQGEEAWDNPRVTRDLIAAVKAKGYDSVRLPMTVYRRYTVNPGSSDTYAIDPAWLARYKEVADWAVAEGLYVMVNLHHDSWIWLNEWDGDPASEEYRMFADFWKQIAECFAYAGDEVCFETINEPDFGATGGMAAQNKLDAINRAAYDAIRAVSPDRMIVMPTMGDTHEGSASLRRFIRTLNDERILATVHYYSEWVFSANLGITGFDETLWLENGSGYTARKAADAFYKTLDEEFSSKGVGVVVGEYGLLGYDKAEDCLQKGEELKYYEYMSHLAREAQGISLMFWDSGYGIDRKDPSRWKNPLTGDMLEAGIYGRSSYATGLDTLYFDKEAESDVSVPLTLNGNTFTGIEGLAPGVDYAYDAGGGAVILKKEYINDQFRALGDGYGTFDTLVMTFSAGANWTQNLVKFGAPVFYAGEGARGGIVIPADFHGSHVRRITVYQGSERVGPNADWWKYLENCAAFLVGHEAGFLMFRYDFFDFSVKNGSLRVVIEFYDGQLVELTMTVDGDVVSVSGPVAGVPSAPRDFAATAGDGQVTLSWGEPIDDGGAAITAYQVSQDGGATWAAAESDTGHTFTGLTNDTDYTFQVRAVNSAGPGEEASVTATPFAAIPLIPLAGTVAIEGGNSAGAVQTAVVTWDSAFLADNPDIGLEQHYDIQWLRGTDVVQSNFSYDYTLTEADLGQEITVRIIGKGDYTGTLSDSKYILSSVHTEHDFGTDWVSDAADHWHECECGEEADKAAHVENGGQVTTEPTETSTGVKTFSCAVCGRALRTEAIPELEPGHTHGYGTDWVSDAAEHWRECDCGEKADKAAHIENDGQVTTEPTATATGMMTFSCAICGKTLRTEVILAATHAVAVENGTGGGYYKTGDTVSITAGETGKLFDKWVSADGVIFADENSESTTFIMPGRPVTVTATYKEITGQGVEVVVDVTVMPDVKVTVMIFFNGRTVYEETFPKG